MAATNTLLPPLLVGRKPPIPVTLPFFVVSPYVSVTYPFTWTRHFIHVCSSYTTYTTRRSSTYTTRSSIAPTPPEGIAPTPPEAGAPTPPEAVAPTPPEGIAPTPPEAVAPTPPEVITPTPLDVIHLYQQRRTLTICSVAVHACSIF